MARHHTIQIPIPEAVVPKLAYTVEEAGEALNMGKSQTFELIHEGRLKVVQLGRKILVPVAECQAFLERELKPYRQEPPEIAR